MNMHPSFQGPPFSRADPPAPARLLAHRFGYSRGCDQAKKCDEAAALEDLAGKGPNSAKHRAAEARKPGGHKSGGARRTTACTLANQVMKGGGA